VGVAGDVGVPRDVSVEVGAADAAVSVKFAITVCAAEVVMKAMFGVAAEGWTGAQATSKNIPIHVTANSFVFIVVLLYRYCDTLMETHAAWPNQ